MTQTPESRYEVLRDLDRGEFGPVVLARDRRLDRQVVIKRIDPAFTANTWAISRFQREAPMAAGLEHPGIVATYDVARDEQGPYLTLEPAPGQTLAAILSVEGRLAPERALALFRQAGEALAFAHSRGVFHLRLHPSSILVTPEGQARVSDFGLAWLAGEPGEEIQEIPGAVGFAAPEWRITGSRLDARADVYSLAAVLYACLTGQPPQPVRQELLPRGLRSPLLRALSADPQARPASIEELLRELAKPALQGRPRRLALMLAPAVVVLAVFAVLMVGRKGGDRKVDQPRDPESVAAQPPSAPRPDTAQQAAAPREPVVPASAGGTVEPPPELTTAVESLVLRRDSVDNLWAFGFVKNQSPVAIAQPRIDITLLDDKGAKIGDGYAFAKFDLLEPGVRAPFALVFQNPAPGYPKPKADVQAKPPYSKTQRLAKLQIVGQRLVDGDLGQRRLKVTLRNVDDRVVRFAEAVAVFYDAKDEIVGVFFGYAKAQDLPPGQESEAEVMVHTLGGPAARYEVFAHSSLFGD